MDVTAGACSVKLDGSEETKSYAAGTSFSVPANSGFDIEVTEVMDYICHYKAAVLGRESVDRESVAADVPAGPSYAKATMTHKANVYHGGKVTSRAVITAENEKVTLGIMLLGQYTFG